MNHLGRGIRYLPGGEQSGEDLLQQVDQRPVVFRGPGERRAPAFGPADDRHAEAVERPHRRAAGRLVPETAADAFVELVPGVPCEGEQEQFRRAPEASQDEPAGLGDDHRGLAAAGRGDHEGCGLRRPRPLCAARR